MIIARREERARVASQRSLIGQIGYIAHRLAAEARVPWLRVTQTALGSPGVFDPAHGYVAMAPNLPGWGRQGLVEAVRQQLGSDVIFENDVNLAALAEQDPGLGRNSRNFVLLSIGTGIGLALVIDGELRRGAFSAARRGNRAAQQVVDLEARRLALAIATITPVVDPELVILGGGVGRNGDLLLERIERELSQLQPFRPAIAVSTLGDDAVLQGAVSIALAAARERVLNRVPGR